MQFLPFPWQIISLAVLGGCLGSAINYGIYAWTWFLKRPLSPWQIADPQASARYWMDYVPVFGWWSLRRDRGLWGDWFWIRPLILELVWLVGLPWFYFWLRDGGLVGGPLQPTPPGWLGTVEVWFWLHSALLALMCVATFIDFDERTIPDAITIPGTLLALAMAALFPNSRMPEVSSNLAGQVMEPVSYANGTIHPLFGIEPSAFARGVDWHQSLYKIIYLGLKVQQLPLDSTFQKEKAILLLIDTLPLCFFMKKKFKNSKRIIYNHSQSL